MPHQAWQVCLSRGVVKESGDATSQNYYGYIQVYKHMYHTWGVILGSSLGHRWVMGLGGASVVVLGEDEWRKGRRASLLGLGGPSGVAGTRWGGRRASLGLCGAGVGL